VTSIAASWPAFFMTFNLLLLNEFPDEPADRKGGRRNLLLLFGRPVAARIYALAALLVPTSLIVAAALGALPPLALLAVLPSLLLAKPLQWALTKPAEPVPIPALAANVVWNLATNSLLAIALFIAAR
jgi:1,4-dihydroxy-2-naphthoate octaprenyltransferase